MNKKIKIVLLILLLSSTLINPVFSEAVSCPEEIYCSTEVPGTHFYYKDGRVLSRNNEWKIEERGITNCSEPGNRKFKLKAYYPKTIIADEFKDSGLTLNCEYEVKNSSNHTYFHIFLTQNIYQVVGDSWDYIYYDTPRKAHKMMAVCRADIKTPIEARYADYKNCTAIK